MIKASVVVCGSQWLLGPLKSEDLRALGLNHLNLKTQKQDLRRRPGSSKNPFVKMEQNKKLRTVPLHCDAFGLRTHKEKRT